jgi:NAD(P)-dependent dehydrogenase (short-subunit alcohol dehydrogenase family)
MKNKTIVLTGATSGIGLSTAEALAATGARLVLVVRNPSKAAQVVANLAEQTGNRSLDVVEADFSSLGSVRRGAEEILERCPRIDVLLNNAGMLNTSRRETVDGFEETFAVNQLAPFLLTELLRERIVACGSAEEPARIVNVASDAHRFSDLAMDDLDSRKSYSAMKVYGMSKRANILWTYELARRLQGQPVTANCLHPGAVRTGLGRNNAPAWLGALLYGLLSPFLRKPDGGARTSVWLATDPEARQYSGRYFKDCRVARSDKASGDEALAAQLWDECARRVGL